MNIFKKLERELHARNRNKPPIQIITNHQDDMGKAYQLEKILSYMIKKEKEDSVNKEKP